VQQLQTDGRSVGHVEDEGREGYMLLRLGCATIGALVIVVVQFDILVTVLHPGVEGPLSTRFHRSAWRLLHLLARAVPGGTRRHAFLTGGLPLLIAGLIGLWLAGLLVGFALVDYPWLGDPACFAAPPGADPSPAEALYFSGVTLFTLGYGDIQPVAGPFRALAVLEAAGGVLTVSFSVAYLLAVYPALARQRAVAIALDAEVAGQAGGLPLVRRYRRADGGWDGQLEVRLRELGLELLALTESHETHPVLYYAHPRRAQHSFLRMLLTVRGLVGLLRYGLAPERHADLVRNPQLLLLEQALGYSLRRLADSLHSPPVAAAAGAAERRRLAAEYAGLCADLEGLGLASARQVAARPVPALVAPAGTGDADAGTGPDPAGGVATYAGEPDVLDPALDFTSDSPVAAYVAFRLATDPYLAAYAAASGYTVAQAGATDETGWWVGGRSAGTLTRLRCARRRCPASGPAGPGRRAPWGAGHAAPPRWR